MKCHRYITMLAGMLLAVSAAAQQQSSSSSVVRRSAGDDAAGRKSSAQAPGVSDRMQRFFEDPDGDQAQWRKVVYRELDLGNVKNATLYYPEEITDGQENLFRIIMRLLASGKLNAYEYLDGREVFTDEYKVNVRDMLDRFHVLYTDAKGSTERNPRFDIEPSDVPSNEVLSYYILENWEVDKRDSRMRTVVEAICPVLHRAGDFGGEAVRFPMFWVRMSDLRPYLVSQAIFIDDDNNLPEYTYDDFFRMGLYEGDIYKTRNLRNLSMMQMYPDPDDRKKAQDSIQNYLVTYEDKMWTPTREEVIAMREARERAASGDTIAVRDDSQIKKSAARSRRAAKPKQTKIKQAKIKNSSTPSSSATRSVRRRR